MMFPDCVHDPELHLATLPRILDRDDIELLDLCVPYGKAYRSKAIDLIRKSNKTIIYNAHLLPMTAYPLGTFSATEREQMLLLSKDQTDVAYEVGAKYYVSATGPEIEPSRRTEALDGLTIYLSEMCEYMARKGEMGFLIEPADTDVAKKFLLGSSVDTVAFLDRLHQTFPQVGIVVDVAHIPLLGESFDHAFRTASKYLRHVHLGNCVMGDRSNPFWGDMHPPIGIEGGEIDTPQLVEIFGILLDISYLHKDRRGSITVETRPFPGKSEEQTIETNFSRIFTAWEMVG